MSDDASIYQLYADELTAEDRAELIDLNCGDEPWSRAATEWIVGTDVWQSIEKRKTTVWLYRNNTGVIVGFGSLGLTRRPWPLPDGGWSNLLIIPMLGMDRVFHGEPPDSRYRYSTQIVNHLCYEAIELFKSKNRPGGNTLPLLTLYVHRENKRAIRLYEKFGFVIEPEAARGDHLYMIQHFKVPD